MIRHLMRNLPSALAGAFLSALMFYWFFWLSGMLQDHTIIIQFQEKGSAECTSSTSTSLHSHGRQ
jgi:formate/nitrite transporter FocA (FNT family)